MCFVAVITKSGEIEPAYGAGIFTERKTTIMFIYLANNDVDANANDLSNVF